MDLATVEISRAGAREKAAEYRRLAKHATDPAARTELERLVRAYQLAAKEEVSLISLTPTIAAGGFMRRELVKGKGRPHESRKTYLLPRLAVALADARFVFTLGIEQDGSVRFCDRLLPWHNYESGRFDLATGFDVDSETFYGGDRIGSWTREAWAAQVPIIPLGVREKAGLRIDANLRTYAILWEADDWRWMRDPAPTRDPALLRHVAGDIYAVLATWDLTEVERLVLSGRRLEEVV